MSLFSRFRRTRPRPVNGTSAQKQPAPRVVPRPRHIHRPPAFALVVDESYSTEAPFRLSAGRTVTRIAGIQHAAGNYLEQLRASNPTQLAAIVGFAGTARLAHPLAPVGSAFQSQVQAIRLLHPRGSTNLSAGLALALDQLAVAQASRRTLVVITDGKANEQVARLPGLIARAKAMHVRIFTIGVGNNGEAGYDRALLLNMSRTTGGRFASAHSFGQLCRALRQAA